ncbi:MAG: TolC family protein [Bacteroidetes bacterium]|nr:TolC family protein [Bacteroidota bacterium]
MSVVVALIASILSNTLFAQQYTLNEIVNKAISYYPLIRQRNAELKATHAHIATVEGNRFPSLKIHDQVSLGTANSLNGTFFPMGVIVPTAGGVRDENNYNLASGNIGLSYLEWEVYNFGYYNADKKDAIAGQALRQAILNNDKYSITEQVIFLYLELLKQYQSLRVEEENVKRAETIFKAINATVISGLKPGVDSSIARAEFSKAKINYLKILTKYCDSRITLSNYTGIDTADIIPDTSIFSKTKNIDSEEILWNDSISDSHPFLDVYKKQYNLQIADNKLIAKKYLPKIFIVGVASMRGSSISSSDIYSSNLADGLSYSRYNYAAGAAFTYNLFDLKHRRDQLIEGRYNAEAKKEALNNSRNSLAMALAQAKEAYNNTLLQLHDIPLQVTAYRQAYEQQIALYKAGLNTLVDVTNALYGLNEAELNYVTAQDSILRLLAIRAGINNQLNTFLEKFK